jgi:hypothetical protein
MNKNNNFYSFLLSHFIILASIIAEIRYLLSFEILHLLSINFLILLAFLIMAHKIK